MRGPDKAAIRATLSRREAIQLGAVAGCLVTAPALAAESFKPSAMRTLGPALGRVELALVEPGLRAAPALAMALRQFGLPMLGMGHDITDVWVNDLADKWRGSGARASVAGLTSPHVLLCLEQLAHLHDMRVVWREAAPTTASTSSLPVDGAWAISVAQAWNGSGEDRIASGRTSSIVTAGQMAAGVPVAWVMAARLEKDRLS